MSSKRRDAMRTSSTRLTIGARGAPYADQCFVVVK
jgi:hypothetical protein